MSLKKRRGYANVADVMANCIVDSVSRCWIWQGAANGDGRRTPVLYSIDYARVEKRCQSGARAVFQLAHHRAILPGHVVIRSCGHRMCLNPVHLREVRGIEGVMEHIKRSGRLKGTHTESRRANSRAGRKAQGINDTPDEIVMQVRAEPEAKSSLQIALERGISHSAVCRMRRGDTYKHLPMGGAPHEAGQ